MRVYEVAKELDVSAEALVHLLREMDIPVRSHMTLLGEEHVSRLRTVMERERRLGHSTSDRAIEAAIGDAQVGPRRRRRRRADEPDAATGDAGEPPVGEEVEEAAESAPEVATATP